MTALLFVVAVLVLCVGAAYLIDPASVTILIP